MLTKLKDYVGISTTKQCQMMTSLVARVKFIKIKIVLGIIPKASQTKFHQIWITKPKVIHVQVPVPRWEKRKNEKNFWVTKRGIKGIDYKPEQVSGVTNRGKKEYKQGQL